MMPDFVIEKALRKLGPGYYIKRERRGFSAHAPYLNKAGEHVGSMPLTGTCKTMQAAVGKMLKRMLDKDGKVGKIVSGCTIVSGKVNGKPKSFCMECGVSCRKDPKDPKKWIHNYRKKRKYNPPV